MFKIIQIIWESGKFIIRPHTSATKPHRGKLIQFRHGANKSSEVGSTDQGNASLENKSSTINNKDVDLINSGGASKFDPLPTKVDPQKKKQ